MNGRRIPIAGSAPQHSDGLQSSTLSPEQQLTATIVLRRRPGSQDIGEQLLSGHFEPISRDEAASTIGADPQDIAAVEAFAQQYDLQLTSADPATRRVKVSGSVRNLEKAFGVELRNYGNYVSYRGPLTVPESLSDSIIAVLGLDTRPVARPRTNIAAV